MVEIIPVNPINMDLTDLITETINIEQPMFDGKPLYVHEVKLLNNDQQKRAYREKQNSLNVSDEKLLYHGTPLRNIETIISNNFDMSKPGTGMSGHIGRGIYFSNMAEQSIYYCLKEKYLGTETDFIILVCKVELGKCCELVRSSETCDCSKIQGYDSHSTPYSQGMKHGNEYCLFDSDQILPICRLHLKVK